MLTTPKPRETGPWGHLSQALTPSQGLRVCFMEQPGVMVPLDKHARLALSLKKSVLPQPGMWKANTVPSFPANEDSWNVWAGQLAAEDCVWGDIPPAIKGTLRSSEDRTVTAPAKGATEGRHQARPTEWTRLAFSNSKKITYEALAT